MIDNPLEPLGAIIILWALAADKWERAATLVAQTLASFRLAPGSEPIFNVDDMLRAGLIIGALWGNDLIAFSGSPVTNGNHQ